MQERGKKERRELAVRKGLRPKLPTLKMEEESQKSRNAGGILNLQKKGTEPTER